ncbi:MAG TPA: hypothetical protein VH442_01390 [Micromonosporaceae bacterium]|jgi:hypothetical protein
MRSTGIDTMFSHAEWDLLVRLPGRIVVAATSAGADGSQRTVAEALAGLDAIAGGRESPNALVREVVGAIYAELGADVDFDATDRATGLAQVLIACQQAAAALAEHGTPADREAYQRWLSNIAFRVCEASGSPDRDERAVPDPVEQQFLTGLSAAFR